MATTRNPQRPDPEQLLKKVQAEEDAARRGKLKIFLGYASGVGKSFRMLDEGRRRKERGEDVVVAAAQPDPPVEIQQLLDGLEIIPLKQNMLDMAAIERRKPGVCLIDGLAYDNAPGSRNAQRWQDVEQLIESGIGVITSLNLQHVEEKAAQVERIRGKPCSSTVPEAFIKRADEISIVDAPAEYCREHGNEEQLSELREIALLLAADVVDHQLEDYLRANGIVQNYGAQERILVCVTSRQSAETIIRRGRRQADRFHGDLFVAWVEQLNLSEQDRAMVDRNLAFAREMNAHVEILSGEDPVDTIIDFARTKGITQIFVGHSQNNGWFQRAFGTLLERLILQADGMDVRVFPHA